MRGYMFRNRWLALLFVAMTLAAVTRLVGTEEDGGALEDATKQIVAQREAADAMNPELDSDAPDSEVTVEFTPDEELVDPASGEDPTPVDEFAQTQTDPAAVPHDEVVIVSQGPPQAPPVP